MNLKFIIIFIPFVLKAQIKTDSLKKVKYLMAPVLFKTPETGWAYGVSGSTNFKTTFRSDSLTRTSVITTLGVFSEKQQNVQAIDATIYFPKEKYVLYSQIAHSYFPDKFWGIGYTAKDKNEERYVFEQLTINPHVKRKIKKNVFFGVLFDYQSILNLKYKQGSLMESTFFYGKTNYHILGLGISASYDTRNSSFWPTKGIFLQTQFTTYNTSVASSYTFNKWLLECRFFKKLSKKGVIAGQFYNYFTFGQTPYRSLASFGGASNLRGFYQGRYRDNAMYSAIIEYRAHLFWKISICLFWGAGNVYSNFNNINQQPIKRSFGGGLRFKLLEKENFNFRLDYGYSDNYNKGFYFTVGECF